MIFAGSIRYVANFDAVNWFLNDIYPIIRSETKDVRLTITGDQGGSICPLRPMWYQPEECGMRAS